jgi:hypothetical protein
VDIMNRNPIIIETSPTLNLNSKPLALRLPVGAAVFGLQGTAWLTQEQVPDDVILTPGDRFDVERETLVLASAIRDAAVIHIVQPAAARAHVHPDVYDFARARAQQLRREEMSRVADLVGTAVVSWMGRLRNSLAPQRGALGH